MTRHTCMDSNVDSRAARIAFSWYQLVVLFCLPVGAMSYCYTVVTRVLWNSTKQLAKMTNSQRWGEEGNYYAASPFPWPTPLQKCGIWGSSLAAMIWCCLKRRFFFLLICSWYHVSFSLHPRVLLVSYRCRFPFRHICNYWIYWTNAFLFQTSPGSDFHSFFYRSVRSAFRVSHDRFRFIAQHLSRCKKFASVRFRLARCALFQRRSLITVFSPI